MTIVGLFLIVALIGEIYYWFWWLPRHWKKIPDCQNIIFFLETMIEYKENHNVN